MKTARQFIFVLVVLKGSLLVNQPGFGQPLSTEGKDFWLGFLDNWLQDPSNPIHLEIYISADDTTSGVLDMPLVPGFQQVHFSVVPGQTTFLTVPTHLAMAFGSGAIQNKGIHIETDKSVSVYAMNKRQYSADMAVVLPVHSLGSDYYVMSHWENGNRNSNQHSDSEFLVVGVGEETEIEITPSVNTISGQPAGVPYIIKLHRGEVYQLQAAADLTGSRVRSVNGASGGCGEFAVFGGNRYTKVGGCAHPDGHDHLYAQMYPANTWGRDYIVVPFATRTGGDMVKVLASEDATLVTVNQQSVFLNKGEFERFFIKDVSTVTSGKPVSVAQYSLSQGCDNTRGDPFMVMISPNEQLMSKITFNAPPIATISSYNLTVIAPNSSVASVRFDGDLMGSGFGPVPGNENYSFITFNSSGGNHTLEAESGGFIAYIYGYGQNESFGYPTGAALGNLKVDFSILSSSGTLLEPDSICPLMEVHFLPQTEYLFDSYRWDFGDGTSFVSNGGESVLHQYDVPGEYVVTLTAMLGNGDCGGGNQETSVKIVRAKYPEVSILGPASICPNTANVHYLAEGVGLYSFVWSVDGGAIESANGRETKVDWGHTNSNAAVKLVATNRFGCNSEQALLPVKINVQLQPEQPVGPDSLCIDNAVDVTYGTYLVEGTSYNWEIEGGSVLSGQGSHEVMVNWEQPGRGSIWFEQLTTTDTICSGYSDTLRVFLQRSPEIGGEMAVSPNPVNMLQEVRLSLSVDPLYTLVNWSFGDGTGIDSVSVTQEIAHAYLCHGTYEVKAIAFDTTLLCDKKAEVAASVVVRRPEVEILRVTHVNDAANSLQVNWIPAGPDKPQLIYRRRYLPHVSEWELVAAVDATADSFVDAADLETMLFGYQYQVVTNVDCDDPFFSEPHGSILLEGERRIDSTGLALMWNEYAGWEKGVDNYEMWMKIDDGDHALIAIVDDTFLDVDYNENGFEYCFRLKATEVEGHLSTSWSNEMCINFIPRLFAYNVLTPNHDGKNEYFIIEGIELYKNSVLTIFDRSGREVFTTRAYSNNWDAKRGENPLPSGVYYYSLELNEPRVPTTVVKGTVTIMR